VVLTTGCDKTTPACLMAAATVDLPAIVLSGGPMLNGWFNGERTGSGPSCGRPASCWPPVRSTRRRSWRWSPPPRRRRALQHDGHRVDHELAGEALG
jgi:hypothetical protein